MRKTFIESNGERHTEQPVWLNLEHIAAVEVTSEDSLFPIEHALTQSPSTGWRAAHPGPQTIRLRFDQPQELHLIHLHIVDRASERTQEFLLSVEMAGMGLQEVRRQQFTFSPAGSTEEIEDIQVELAHVLMLELRIDPDRSHDPRQSQHYATLTALRLA